MTWMLIAAVLCRCAVANWFIRFTGQFQEAAWVATRGEGVLDPDVWVRCGFQSC